MFILPLLLVGSLCARHLLNVHCVFVWSHNCVPWLVSLPVPHIGPDVLSRQCQISQNAFSFSLPFPNCFSFLFLHNTRAYWITHSFLFPLLVPWLASYNTEPTRAVSFIHFSYFLPPFLFLLRSMGSSTRTFCGSS